MDNYEEQENNIVLSLKEFFLGGKDKKVEKYLDHDHDHDHDGEDETSSEHEKALFKTLREFKIDLDEANLAHIEKLGHFSAGSLKKKLENTLLNSNIDDEVKQEPPKVNDNKEQLKKFIYEDVEGEIYINLKKS